jgi:hypothetical protein
LEPEFKLVAKLDARDTWPAYFTDLDHDAHYYYIAEDWTFAYWPGSFAGSPNHSVVLKFVDDANGGGYHLALDKMTTPPPTPTIWAKNLEDVRQEQQLEDTGWYNNLEGVLWQNILDLLYTSHSDLAWKFLEESRRTAKNLGPVHTTLVGGDGSQFFSSQGVRSDGYRVYPSDDGRRGGENWPRPCGLRRNSGHTLLSA